MSNEFLERLQDIGYEPTRVQGVVVDLFENALDGKVDINDPGTPAVKLMEMAVMLSMGAVRNDEVLDRKSYPFMALNENDLYSHMSDKDYLDMYAHPGETTFKFYFSKSEIISRSIQVGNSAVRKLSIPKHTRVTAAGIPFTMQYPIDFLVKRNGAIDIVLDLSKESPLQHFESNKVEWNVIQINGINDEDGIMDIIEVDVPMKQMLLSSHYVTVSSSSVLKKKIKFNNSYHSTRAYLKGSDGQWREIKTTYSEQSFNVTEPTLLLTVIKGELIYELPYIYLLGNLNGREIRVDVYTTNGKHDANLAEIDPSQFSVEFMDLDDDSNGIYTSPISILDTFDIRNLGYLTGGRDVPSFRRRRELVINNNVGEIKLPVTSGQMDTAISRLGFDSALAIDDITRRTFIASRRYPGSDKLDNLSIDAGMITLRSSFTKLVDHPKVKDNGDRLVLTPDLLFTTSDSGLKILSELEKGALVNGDKETMINRLNNGRYFWSPFHYVLDISDNRFSSKAYLLTEPVIKSTSFIGSNDETGLLVMTGHNRKVTWSDEGYKITIVSDSSGAFKEIDDEDVVVQLMIMDGSTYGYMNGKVSGRTPNNHLIVEFDIPTKWNIIDKKIEISGFEMKNGSRLPIWVDLDTDFELIWGARLGATEDVLRGSIDSVVGEHILDDEFVGIYHESLNIKLGDQLDNLWTGARMVISDRSPLRHEEDVYLTYGPRDISRYKIDPVTGLPEVKIVNGKNELIILHQVGDPVLDETTGEPIVLYKKGSIILNPNGEMEYESDRGTQWWADLTLFDARFKFADSKDIKDYVKYISDLSVTWSNETLGHLNSTALERTRIFYSPKNSINDVMVIADDSEEIRINPSQSITIDLFVVKSVYQDYELRESLEKSIKEDVIEYISEEVVSMSEMEENIMTAMPNGVVAIKASGLGGSMDYRTVTVMDGRNRLSVDKEMFIDSDYTVGIRNSIRVIFRLHGNI